MNPAIKINPSKANVISIPIMSEPLLAGDKNPTAENSVAKNSCTPDPANTQNVIG